MSSAWGNNAFPGQNYADGNNRNFAHTDGGGNEWIEIDLGAITTIYQINVYNRTDCCSNRATGIICMVNNNSMRSGGSNPIYTSKPFPNKNGTTVPNPGDYRNVNGYWGIFTMFPSDKTVFGFPIGTIPPRSFTKSASIKLQNIKYKQTKRWETIKLPYKTNAVLIQNDQVDSSTYFSLPEPGSRNKKLLSGTRFDIGRQDIIDGSIDLELEVTKNWNGQTKSKNLGTKNSISNTTTFPPKTYPDNRSPCMAKLKDLDTFTNLDSTQMFENVTDEDLNQDIYQTESELNNNINNNEYFSNNLVEKTQSCSTNFYIMLLIVAIIILYLLSSAKTEFTEYTEN
jgi:hypothetical protein